MAIPNTGGIYAILDGETFHISYETFHHVFREPWLTTHTPGHLDVDLLVHKSPLVRCGDVNEADMYNAWRLVLGTLSTTFGYCEGMTLIIKNALEVSIAQDLSNHRSGGASSCAYPQSLVAFMCLSSISNQTGSHLIGSGLSQFWAHRGPRIVAEDSYYLVVWANAIFRACMPGNLKLAALQEFLKADPSTLEQMRYSSPSTARILTTLEDIDDYQLDNFDAMLTDFRGSSFPSGLLRPPISGFESPYSIERPRSTPLIGGLYRNGGYLRQSHLRYRPDHLFAGPASPLHLRQTNKMLLNTDRRIRRLENDVAVTKNAAIAAFGDSSYRVTRPCLPRSRSEKLYPPLALGAPLTYR